MDIYEDREEAGQRLADELSAYAHSPCIVFGIPRGGVVVAAQVALRLNCPLDIVAPRKIGAPGEPEYAIGAVCSWGSERFINEEAIRMLHLPNEYIESETAHQLKEARRRLVLYRGSIDPPELINRVVIVVDDGVATGYTTRAALASIRNLSPLKLILAVPVGAPDSIISLRRYADEVICPKQPVLFRAVGNWYRYFDQTSDKEVITILQDMRNRQPDEKNCDLQ